MAATHGQNNDLFGVLLDLSNLPAYRIDELKFWLKCREDSLKKNSPEGLVYSKVRIVSIHSRRG